MMFRPYYGFCKWCEKDDQLIVVRSGHCQLCNHDKKQKSKKVAGKSVAKYRHIPKSKGEAPLFEEIASEREWVCFVTGEKLWELKPTQFMHVLPKALNRYPKFRLYKKNIVLASDWAHRMWDFAPRSEVKKDPRFDKLFELEAELKEDYKQGKFLD